MSGPATAALRLADVLDGAGEPDVPLRAVHSFGGLHGGLLAAMLLRAARRAAAPDLVPVELSTHFLRPVAGRPDLAADVLHTGRSVTAVTAQASAGGRPAAAGTAVLVTGDGAGGALVPTVTPLPPADLVPPERSDRFAPPPEFVPISTRMEIRPATPALPYSGAAEPELCAWVRLLDPVADPYERLLVLADALAPSYAAVLTELRPVPTVRLTVRFAPAVRDADADWVLVHARTLDTLADGWLTEALTLWTPDGRPLASASQLRVVR